MAVEFRHVAYDCRKLGFKAVAIAWIVAVKSGGPYCEAGGPGLLHRSDPFRVGNRTGNNHRLLCRLADSGNQSGYVV